MFDFFAIKEHPKASDTWKVELSYMELYYLVEILDNINPRFDVNSQKVLEEIREKFREAQETIR